jgi:hypothetical protein
MHEAERKDSLEERKDYEQVCGDTKIDSATTTSSSIPGFVKNLFRDKQLRKFKKYIKELDLQMQLRPMLLKQSQTSQDWTDQSGAPKFETIIQFIKNEVEQLS